jgi:Peptidase M16 inactive domain
MKKRPYFARFAMAALLVSAASCRCGGSPPERRAETLAERSVKLQNGLAVDLVAGPCGDSAALVVHLDVGIDHDPPGRSGMARLAERVLATSAPAGRAARTVEAGDDYTLYSVVVPADRLPDELSDVAAWMSNVTPTDADLARERAAVLAELAKLSGADARSTAMHLAEEAVRPTHGEGKRHGIPSEVEAITLPELVAFWQAYFKPGNARITVAGRFDAEKVRTHIETAFGPLPAGTPPVARPPTAASVRGTMVMGNAPTAVAVAVPAPAPSDPLYPPFLVLAGRLMEKTSPPRTWEASYDPTLRPELLFITGPVGPAEQPEPGAARIRAEVAAVLARPPTPADIAAAQERFRLFLDPTLDPATCAKDARAFAVARTRRAQMQLEGSAILQALQATTKEQLEAAAGLFEPKLTAGVIAGGAIR